MSDAIEPPFDSTREPDKSGERRSPRESGPAPAIGPPFISPCECCGRDTPTTICLDVEGNAVLLCIDCQDLLTEAESG